MSALGETFTFDLEGLMMGADKTRAAFEAAEPFPHVVIDGFLTPAALAAALEAFPRADSGVWNLQDWTIEGHRVSLKKACSEELQIPVPIRRILRELNCSLFLRYLWQATGIPLLMPDPTWLGNAIFLIEPGGFLNVHADYSNHFETRLDHRVNLLLYLNHDWREEYGGHLQFWQPGVAEPIRSILPIANRCVIFDATSRSFHGHPQPLTCPPDRTRNCLAVSYYTNGRPEGATFEPHETIWTFNPYLT
jgi:hypothetical protein